MGTTMERRPRLGTNRESTSNRRDQQYTELQVVSVAQHELQLLLQDLESDD
jgi:hypothetical protein